VSINTQITISVITFNMFSSRILSVMTIMTVLIALHLLTNPSVTTVEALTKTSHMSEAEIERLAEKWFDEDELDEPSDSKYYREKDEEGHLKRDGHGRLLPPKPKAGFKMEMVFAALRGGEDKWSKEDTEKEAKRYGDVSFY
jgi:hypothetical protein